MPGGSQPGGPQPDMPMPGGPQRPGLFIDNVPPMHDFPPFMSNDRRRNKPNAFVIIKPGFLSHKSELEDILSKNGWDIITSNEKTLTIDEAKELYKSKSKEDYYDDLCEYMSSGKCRYYLLYKECDDPISEMNDIKDKCRKKWSKTDMKNFMHSSDSIRNVNRESSIIVS